MVYVNTVLYIYRIFQLSIALYNTEYDKDLLILLFVFLHDIV